MYTSIQYRTHLWANLRSKLRLKNAHVPNDPILQLQTYAVMFAHNVNPQI
jgi:hypothetical protein